MRAERAIDRPPRTIMEVYRTLPEGTLAELINGIIYMSPSPIKEHQRIVVKLVASINTHAEENDLGEVYVAPFDVYLDEHANAVQPDIIFVAKENSSIVQSHIHGVPDLLIEILSPGNREYDLKKKKELYEQFQVKEYWIVDPVTKETIGYLLKKGKFEAPLKLTGIIQSALLNKDFVF